MVVDVHLVRLQKLAELVDIPALPSPLVQPLFIPVRASRPVQGPIWI